MFEPKRVIIEEAALEYKSGKRIFNELNNKNIEIIFSKNGIVNKIPGNSSSEKYFEGKSTLVVGIRKTLKFESCKPSAHYQLPLVSGCMGMCEYCYLNTQMGKKPYIKVYVNINEILQKAGEYALERKPDITIFEGAATSDPIPVEPYTDALKSAIEYFATNNLTEFRFVTKFTDVDSLLNLKHNNRTTIRFSINTDDIINKFEHKTPAINERIDAAYKVAKAGYKIGFIIAPVFLYEDWKKEYLDLMIAIADKFNGIDLKFEVISHRYTKKAKENILSVYPKSLLPMEEEIRKFKYGQFGYGKYVYMDKELKEMKEFFNNELSKLFGKDSINYII